MVKKTLFSFAVCTNGAAAYIIKRRLYKKTEPRKEFCILQYIKFYLPSLSGFLLNSFLTYPTK